MKKTDEAFADYSLAISIDEKNPSNFNYRGYAYNELNNYNLSIIDFNNCIKIDSTYSNCYSNRADAYFALEDYENALNDYSKVIELQPEDPDYLIDRSDCYVALEDYDNALIDRSKAIDVAIEKEDYFTYRADFYDTYLDNSEKSLEDYDKAISLSPEFKWPLNNKATLLINLERYEEALKIYDDICLLYTSPSPRAS